jgi:hypothetical protein
MSGCAEENLGRPIRHEGHGRRGKHDSRAWAVFSKLLLCYAMLHADTQLWHKIKIEIKSRIKIEKEELPPVYGWF